VTKASHSARLAAAGWMAARAAVGMVINTLGPQVVRDDHLDSGEADCNDSRLDSHLNGVQAR
jgi:hypothetical protein